MDSLYVRTAIAGFFFALWPMFMNRSGLSATASSFSLVAGVATIITPFLLYRGFGPLPQGVQWLALLGACACCATGNLFFGTVVIAANPVKLSSLFLVLVLAQIATGAMYQVMITGSLTLAQALGFVAAGVAAYLLS